MQPSNYRPISLTSISGYVIVGVRPDLPVKGVSLLLGINTLANPNSTPLIKTLSPIAVSSDKGATPSANRDCDVPVSRRIVIGMGGLLSLIELIESIIRE